MFHEKNKRRHIEADEEKFEEIEDNSAQPLPECNKSIKLRSNFDPLATFTSSLLTNSDGEASVHFTMPDSITRYRVFAVASTLCEFGVGNSNIVAQLPMLLRVYKPNFVNFSDEFTVKVCVQNVTPYPLRAILGVKLLSSHVAFQENHTDPHQFGIPSFPPSSMMKYYELLIYIFFIVDHFHNHHYYNRHEECFQTNLIVFNGYIKKGITSRLKVEEVRQYTSP